VARTARRGGEDRFGERRGLGISVIEFKAVTQDPGGLFVLENVFHAKGGAPCHLHDEQDEWFYAIEGESVLEVGEEQFRLRSGDLVLAPWRVPQVWAHVGEWCSRTLIAFAPTGTMEAFVREVTKANVMPPQDPELWRTHGMELLGPH
jgi:mannose-6-phosphate isomerase-like protein (cupin superfamily)